MAIKPFSATLTELRAGITADELSAKINECVAAVRLTGKPGEVTFKLKIKPFSNGNTDVLNIEDDITAKIPKLDRGGTVFFATVENNLSRQDPQQMALFELREAPKNHFDSLKEIA